MLAALNAIDVFDTEIGNTYLNASCREKIWMCHVDTLYRLKSSGAYWRVMLAETLAKDGLGYTSTATDKYVWIKREVLPNEKDYYSMVLVYVDDICFIQKDTSVVIDALASIYVTKQETMGPPDRYLVANTEKLQTQDGKVMWETHRRDYFKASIENMEKTLTADGKAFFSTGMVGDHIRQVSTQRLTPLLNSMRIVSMINNITLVCCVGRLNLAESTSWLI